MRRGWLCLLTVWLTLVVQPPSAGKTPPGAAVPQRGEVWQVVTLRDYNTRVVVAGVSALGLAAGLIGCFLLLRGRALLADALSHATLPGIGLGFLVMTTAGGSGKSLPGLLVGATLAGVLGILCILWIVHRTRLKEDAALGLVLSVFFGGGVAILGLVQSSNAGHAAGLQSFIYGKTASMLGREAWTLALVAGGIAVACGLLFKEFSLLCFDAGFARAQGWPVFGLDVALMALVVGVTVVGLQAVGLILIVALLVIPPAAARFWTDHLPSMLATSGLLGAASGLVGALLSALLPRLPAGAVIVVVAGGFFALSLVFGPARGLLVRGVAQRTLARKVARQHLLRAMYELGEAEPGPGRAPAIGLEALQAAHAWSSRQLARALAGAVRDGLVAAAGASRYELTPAGRQAAWRVARNHRLWELYLITHADIAPSHVDRDADQVEHVLGPELLRELEALLSRQYPDLAAPASPHQITRPAVAEVPT